jgi:tetratricopeptide (TPR) repeat protein
VREADARAFDGEILAGEGDLPAALAEFEAATVLVPDEPAYWIWVGVLREALGMAPEAQAAFDTARSLDITELDFLLRRARVRLGVGDTASARADVEQALDESPESAAAHYVRSSIALAEGDYFGAVADLERTAELARQEGNHWLEGQARYQLATLLQQPPVGSPLGTPQVEENDGAE